jgi:hypothetical protein
MLTVLRPGLAQGVLVPFPAGARDVSPSQKRPDLLWASPTLATGGSVKEDKTARTCLPLTTQLHLVPRLRMSRAVPPFRPYAFMTYLQTAFILSCYDKLRTEVQATNETPRRPNSYNWTVSNIVLVAHGKRTVVTELV